MNTLFSAYNACYMYIICRPIYVVNIPLDKAGGLHTEQLQIYNNFEPIIYLTYVYVYVKYLIADGTPVSS